MLAVIRLSRLHKRSSQHYWFKAMTLVGGETDTSAQKRLSMPVSLMSLSLGIKPDIVKKNVPKGH